jgi:Holliday junction DNA helicase RuvA
MIDYIFGVVETKTADFIVLDCSGVGYRVAIAVSTFEKLPPVGSEVKIFIVEAVAGMYGGVINLYGFLTIQERDMYLLIKEEVPGTGAKKALEYMDKISKSFADFKSAISKKDGVMLHSVFGFTKKTADKLIDALKEKIANVSVSGNQKWADMDTSSSNTVVKEAIMALMGMGIKEAQAITAVKKSFENDEDISLTDLIKKSLKRV